MGIKGAWNYKKIMGIVLILVMGLLATGCGEKKIATVNGEVVTMGEFERRLETVQRYYESNMGLQFEGESGAEMLKNLQEMVLDQLITEHLLQQEARKKDIKATKEEVQERIEQDKLMVGGEQAYLDILKNQVKMTEKEYQAEVEKQIVVEKLYKQVVEVQTVSDEEIQNYYEENKGDFYSPEQIKARHILVATEEEGNALIKRINSGADFAQLAVENSIDPTANENQGDMGYFAEDAQFVPEFKEAAFKLKVGEITAKPIKTQFGYHIIKVEDRKAAGQQSLAEVKDSISEELKSNKESNHFQLYLEDLRQQAKIEKEELPTPEVTPGDSTVTPDNSQNQPVPSPGG
jgi:peptidyl-prolyl cis-trans isomerase C